MNPKLLSLLILLICAQFKWFTNSLTATSTSNELAARPYQIHTRYPVTIPKKSRGNIVDETRADAPVSLTDCSKPVDYWFNKKLKNIWPDMNGVVSGKVKIGFYHYTESEGRAIGYTTDPYGRYDAKHAFMLLVTLRLSGVPETSIVWKNADVVERWLRTVGKISPMNLPPAPDPKMPNYVKLVDAWIKGNLCN